MTTPPLDTITISEVLNATLDKAYADVTRQMFRTIGTISTGPSSQMQLALAELEEHAEQVDGDGGMLKGDDPYLLKTLDAFAALMITVQTLISSSAPSIEATGHEIGIPSVTAKVFPNITTQILLGGGDPIALADRYTGILRQAGITWRVPDAIKTFTSLPAWIERMEGWGMGYANLIRDRMLTGIQDGWGPKVIAAKIRELAVNIPKHATENITRTLQLTAYRESSLAMEKANGAFIISKIRIATLDQRTCLACISLHGSVLEAGQRVDDHYRGRCSEYYVVPGGAATPTFMQADSVPGQRNFVPWQTGEEWFSSLPPERQKVQSSFAQSPGKLNAYLAGNPLSSFVTNHTDTVFGNMVMENSIVGAFGEEQAQQYYVRR